MHTGNARSIINFSSRTCHMAKIMHGLPNRRSRMRDLPRDAHMFLVAFAFMAAGLWCWLGGMI